MRRLRLLIVLLPVACTTSIQHGLDERQATEVQAALAKRGIESGRKAEGGRTSAWSIEVPTRRVSEAVQLLAELGMPHSRPEGWREVYGKGGWIPTASEERALYLTALTGELARTLESFDGVVAARVHLVLPAPSRNGQPAVPAKASVFIRARSEAMARIEDLREPMRGLVAGAVDGLASDAVTLVFEAVTLPPLSPARPPVGAPLAGVAPVLILSGMGAVGWGLIRRRRGRQTLPQLPPLPKKGAR